MLIASADFCLFFGIITTGNDGNIFIEQYIDFLPKTANLQGKDIRKTPKYTQFGKSRQPPRGQDPPARCHPQTYLSRQTRPILSNQNTDSPWPSLFFIGE
jgi:hypothetical protein